MWPGSPSRWRSNWPSDNLLQRLTRCCNRRRLDGLQRVDSPLSHRSVFYCWWRRTERYITGGQSLWS